jgi:teichuronic acid biosynthesis glycosyltransferase TuaG
MERKNMEETGGFPLVTVVMPAYNAEAYIAQAIDSVMEQSTEAAVELVIVNDCSKDATGRITAEKIAYYNRKEKPGRTIRLIENETNLGVAESRNAGIRSAGGAYVAFLDADDWWAPDKLEKQFNKLKQTDAVLCATGRELMQPDGTSMGKTIPVSEEISYRDLLRTNSIPCSSVVMKTAVAQEFYMCHDELHEDYILWLRVLKKYGPAVGVNEPLLKSRMSQGGKSRNKLKSAKMQYGVYRYMGFGRGKTMVLMVSYMVHGVLKYW